MNPTNVDMFLDVTVATLDLKRAVAESAEHVYPQCYAAAPHLITFYTRC
jgi:hypothetical protein